MTQPEKKVKNSIKKSVLDRFPGTWMYMPVQTGYGQHGIPDFVCCVPVVISQEMVGKRIGAFVGIEAKTETGKLSKMQSYQINAIADASGVAVVIKGEVEIDKVISLIEESLS